MRLDLNNLAASLQSGEGVFNAFPHSRTFDGVKHNSVEGQPKMVGASVCRLPVEQTGLHCSARSEIFRIVTEIVGRSDSVSSKKIFKNKSLLFKPGVAMAV